MSAVKQISFIVLGQFYLAAHCYCLQARCCIEPSGSIVRGRVIDALSKAPVVGAELIVIVGPLRKSFDAATSDDRGEFEVKAPQTNEFELRAFREGFIPAVRIRKKPDDSVVIPVVIELKPEATINGRVSEDSGDPVPGAQVTLYQIHNEAEAKSIHEIQAATADEMGYFEFHGLRAGLYYLCASGSPWYGPLALGRASVQLHGTLREVVDVSYAFTCFPGVPGVERADPISIMMGDRLPIDILLHPKAAASQSGETAPTAR